MSKNIIHMSEAEAAATDMGVLLKRVDEGAEIVIEHESRPPAILRSAHARPGQSAEASLLTSEDSQPSLLWKVSRWSETSLP